MNRLLFIYNPTSGTGQAKGALSAVLDVFTKAGWLATSYPTQCKGDAARVVREPPKSPPRRRNYETGHKIGRAHV